MKNLRYFVLEGDIPNITFQESADIIRRIKVKIGDSRDPKHVAEEIAKFIAQNMFYSAIELLNMQKNIRDRHETTKSGPKGGTYKEMGFKTYNDWREAEFLDLAQDGERVLREMPYVNFGDTELEGITETLQIFSRENPEYESAKKMLQELDGKTPEEKRKIFTSTRGLQMYFAHIMSFRDRNENYLVLENILSQKRTQKTEVQDWLSGKSGVCRDFALMFYHIYNAYCEQNYLPSAAIIFHPPRHARNGIIIFNPKDGTSQVHFLDITHFQGGRALFKKDTGSVEEGFHKPWDF